MDAVSGHGVSQGLGLRDWVAVLVVELSAWPVDVDVSARLDVAVALDGIAVGSPIELICLGRSQSRVDGVPLHCVLGPCWHPFGGFNNELRFGPRRAHLDRFFLLFCLLRFRLLLSRTIGWQDGRSGNLDDRPLGGINRGVFRGAGDGLMDGVVLSYLRRTCDAHKDAFCGDGSLAVYRITVLNVASLGRV